MCIRTHCSLYTPPSYLGTASSRIRTRPTQQPRLFPIFATAPRPQKIRGTRRPQKIRGTRHKKSPTRSLRLGNFLTFTGLALKSTIDCANIGVFSTKILRPISCAVKLALVAMESFVPYPQSVLAFPIVMNDCRAIRSV